MNLDSNNIKKVYLKFLIFSILLVLTYVSIDYLFYANTAQKVALNNATNKIKEREKVFNNFINHSKDALYALRDNKYFKLYLENKENKENVEDIFLTFSNSQKNFMQLRYIDKNGFEKIRIDRDRENNTINLIAKNKLQNKSTRYYFADSIKKPYEKVWFSPLDLNMEKGKIQMPYNSTLRAILPIKHNNEFVGIVIINYFMNDFLNSYLNLSLYDSILFDSDGYILKHYDSSKDWSFYRKEKFNISKEYKSEYKQIMSDKPFKSDDFTTNSLNIQTGNHLYLLLKLKDSYVKNQQIEQIEHYIIVAGTTFILSLIIGFLIGRRFASLLNVIEGKNKEQKSLLSLFDQGDSVLFKWNNDENSSLNYVSSNVENLLGYTRDELLSSQIIYSECIFKDDLNRMSAEIKDAKESADDFIKHEPYRIITKDGNIKWVLNYTVLGKNTKGNIIHSLGYVIDITEREEIYRNLQKFIDTQDNIVILTNGKTMNFANKQFFDFLSFKNLDEFQMNNQCICEFFIENDRFFHLGKIDNDENWVEVIQTLQPSNRIVSMIDSNSIIHAFSVTINKFDEILQIISFTDISQTILEHIELEKKTIHDKLTGAYNREYFEQNHQRLINEYTNSGNKFGLALLDIDFFKLVNDNYGHDVGDDVLVQFVKTVQKHSRGDDIFIRWGGEEFILILKVSSSEGLKIALEHIRKILEVEKYEVVGQKTCSIGGTIYQDGEDIEKTIKRADNGVYAAKDSGRNKVVIIEL